MMAKLRIGWKIPQIRLQNKLTLEKVGQGTGFTKSYLSMVESGKKSAKTLAVIYSSS
jgi:transcriptional regulator with XRE-family HTH domain